MEICKHGKRLIRCISCQEENSSRFVSGPGMITRREAQGQIGEYCRSCSLDFNEYWELFQKVFGDYTEYRQIDLDNALARGIE